MFFSGPRCVTVSMKSSIWQAGAARSVNARMRQCLREPALAGNGWLVRTSNRRIASVKDDRIRFDLHEHRRVYQRARFHHRRGRPHRSEHFSVGPADVFPMVSDVHDIHPRPDDVLEAGARPGQGRRDILQCLNGLNIMEMLPR